MYLIMVPLRKNIKVWYSKAQNRSLHSPGATPEVTAAAGGGANCSFQCLKPSFKRACNGSGFTSTPNNLRC